MFSFSRSLFLLFLVFFVRGVRFGEVASLPATPSIFFFFVLVPPFEEVTVELVVTVSSRLSLCDEKEKQEKSDASARLTGRNKFFFDDAGD